MVVRMLGLRVLVRVLGLGRRLLCGRWSRAGPLFVASALGRRLLLGVLALDLRGLCLGGRVADGGLQLLGLGLDAEVEVADGGQGAVEGGGVGGYVVVGRGYVVDGSVRGGHGAARVRGGGRASWDRRLFTLTRGR